MKKFFILLFIICLPVNAVTISGSAEYYNDNKQIAAKFSDGSYAIIYNNDPLNSYYYTSNGVLTHKEKKTSVDYPYISKKYTPDGKLVNFTYRISENEAYIYNINGVLLASWLGKNCYDIKGNIIMTRKFIK